MLLSLLLSLLFNLQPLHDAGYTGQGIKIAVIDVGFYGVDTDSIHFPKANIIGTYDFLHNDSTFYRDPQCVHGSDVLSTMLTRTNANDEALGTAPDASYFLIRTEDVYHETRQEVADLAQAIHMADTMGCDIITISLGYTVFDDPATNYTYDSLNGSSIAARAATVAARHNRLVCVAAGNEGNKTWHYICAPADADSILTVGAVRADSVAAAFSSWGLDDGRNKPEVSALGQATTIYDPSVQSFRAANGTSFACPEIAGMAACLWQAIPTLSAMQLREKIIQSASLYPFWDAQRGYGIPDAAKIFNDTPTAIGEPEQSTEAVRKVWHNGTLLILREGNTYDLLGRKKSAEF